MKKSRMKLDNQHGIHSASKNPGGQYWYQLETIRQRIKYDVAWRIFEEVNADNNTFKHIDLTCLDHEDAVMIARKKILELARHASIQGENIYSATKHWVINIKCAEDHLVHIEDEYGRAPLKNVVLEMVAEEFGLDHRYISTRNTILVRVDKDTHSQLSEQMGKFE